MPGLFAPPGYAHSVTVPPGTRLVLLAGSVPLDATGELVGAGDTVQQARQVIANLEAALADAGSSLQQVLATTVYVVADDPAELARVWVVVDASGLNGGPHTSTLLGVAALGYAGQLVEITATAVVDD